MNELDSVKLLRNFEDLPKGTRGVIVLKYNDECFEVEFFDKADDTIGVYTTPSEYVQKIG